MKLTKEVARKVVETVDAGLCSGLGEPRPGEMCVEAAVCFALSYKRKISCDCYVNDLNCFRFLNETFWLIAELSFGE